MNFKKIFLFVILPLFALIVAWFFLSRIYVLDISFYPRDQFLDLSFSGEVFPYNTSSSENPPYPNCGAEGSYYCDNTYVSSYPPENPPYSSLCSSRELTDLVWTQGIKNGCNGDSTGGWTWRCGGENCPSYGARGTMTCGDGVVNGKEVCDAGIFNDVACVSSQRSPCTYCKGDCSGFITKY
jgi:hypothetical protein